jgi:A/G-specific adenine glycosylase
MRGAARDLPWRRNRSPYAVWISEVMLQQTQVATVIPYFERWLTRFPGVDALAAAPLDNVLKAWEGLGYYARARNLHRAAQLMVERHGGQVPDDRDALLALPGIGQYTVGAILSIAYGRPEPILDGNVRRVLCRVYDIDEDPRRPDVEARLWEHSGSITRSAGSGRAGEVNEAMMELGALVCVPVTPDCPACPIRDLCLAHANRTVAERPVRVSRPVTPHYDVAAAIVVSTEGKALIVRRPPSGLLGGLWGFPNGITRDEEAPEEAAERVVFERTGMTIQPGEALPTVRHAYTHFRITLHPFEARVAAGSAPFHGDADARWVTREELDEVALPVTDRKVAKSWAQKSEGPAATDRGDRNPRSRAATANSAG